MVKEVETVLFLSCLQFSIYNVTVLKVHRRLPATLRETILHEHRTDEMMEDAEYVFFNIGSLVLYYDVGPLCAKWMLPAPSSERLFANNQELRCAPFAEL